jgi:hypothetical protein
MGVSGHVLCRVYEQIRSIRLPEGTLTLWERRLYALTIRVLPPEPGRWQRASKLVLDNRDVDTGKPTKAGEYNLTDKAYARLLNKLTDHKFGDATAALQQNILAFYEPPAVATFNRKKPKQRDRTLKNIEALRLLPNSTTIRQPVPAP